MADSKGEEEIGSFRSLVDVALSTYTGKSKETREISTLSPFKENAERGTADGSSLTSKSPSPSSSYSSAAIPLIKAALSAYTERRNSTPESVAKQPDDPSWGRTNLSSNRALPSSLLPASFRSAASSSSCAGTTNKTRGTPALHKTKGKTEKGPKRDDVDEDTLPYILKRMLADKSCHDSISWSADGLSFAVLRQEKFVTTVLPRYLQGCQKFTNFQRKLNRWGFRVITIITQGRRDRAFQHELFRRDKPHLIKRMETRKTEKTPEPRTATTVPSRSIEKGGEKDTLGKKVEYAVDPDSDYMEEGEEAAGRKRKRPKSLSMSYDDKPPTVGLLHQKRTDCENSATDKSFSKKYHSSDDGLNLQSESNISHDEDIREAPTEHNEQPLPPSKPGANNEYCYEELPSSKYKRRNVVCDGKDDVSHRLQTHAIPDTCTSNEMSDPKSNGSLDDSVDNKDGKRRRSLVIHQPATAHRQRNDTRGTNDDNQAIPSEISSSDVLVPASAKHMPTRKTNDSRQRTRDLSESEDGLEPPVVDTRRRDRYARVLLNSSNRTRNVHPERAAFPQFSRIYEADPALGNFSNFLLAPYFSRQQQDLLTQLPSSSLTRLHRNELPPHMPLPIIINQGMPLIQPYMDVSEYEELVLAAARAIAARRRMHSGPLQVDVVPDRPEAPVYPLVSLHPGLLNSRDASHADFPLEETNWNLPTEQHFNPSEIG